MIIVNITYLNLTTRYQFVKIKYMLVFLPEFIESTIAIVAPMAREKDIDFQVWQSGIVSRYIKLDTTYVRQVVVNLLSNAIKFTSHGGKVEILLENVSHSGRFEKHRMVVRDNGIGISQEFLPKVFLPFEQEDTKNDLSRQGTGLGLSIVKQIVEQMGGNIWVESEKGCGSTFYVEWTLETASEEEFSDAKELINNTHTLSLQGKRILLVEDHPLNAQIAEKLLEKKGLIVERAENGKAPVEQFDSSNEGFYDAVLMDIRMPIMDGLEAAKVIRTLNRRTYMIH